MSVQQITLIPQDRTCGDCTACCEGWLSADIYGERMYRGKKCRFVGEGGCSIYSQRPEVCSSYTCLWLTDPSVPSWMKPNKCGVILSEKFVSGISYIEAVETDKKMDSEILSWLLMLFANHDINVVYMVSGGYNWLGSKEFLDAMANQ